MNRQHLKTNKQHVNNIIAIPTDMYFIFHITLTICIFFSKMSFVRKVLKDIIQIQLNTQTKIPV